MEKLIATEEEMAQQGLSLSRFQEWHEEIKNQPAWRANADKCMDYFDGNQLDAEVLRKQAAIGMPPAIEPLIGPAIEYVLGMEAQHRTDWRVIPDSDKEGDEVATALNEKLNKIERQSKADKACSDAFAGQACVGIGWVEVDRDPNPFNFPYRCIAVDRNEIFWDWRNKDKHGTDQMRYLVRRKWTDKDQAKLFFPDQANLIENAASGWGSFVNMTDDGGKSTGLSMSGAGYSGAYGAVTTPLAGDPPGASYPMLAASYDHERGCSIEEQEWRDTQKNRVCLFEVWYRIWIRALVMKTPDGRVIEYDGDNEMHQIAVATGAVKPFYAVISKVRLSWWLGPHRLSDTPSPYKHNKFKYVPFWGKREDRTGVPYGLIRGMIFLQDNINASTSKIRWGLSATRTTRTDGAVLDDDDTFRAEISRPDADIVLDPNAMAKPGATFKVERDFQLNEQQYKMLVDSREGIKRVGSINPPSESNGVRSGVAEANIAEQGTQSQANLYDNFRVARAEVGELLLSMIVEDMADQQETVVIKGDAMKEDQVIHLNVPVTDPETGMQYLDNDIQRTLLKVGLEEVPHTPSFRSQQLQSFTEVFKAAPDDYQRALFPQLLSLMDVPNKAETIKAIKDAGQQQTPEQIQQQIDDAVAKARLEDMIALKTREIDIKAEAADAQNKKTNADSVKSGVESSYAAMQAAEVIATVPQVAPIADAVMASAGYQAPNPAGDNPNYLTAPEISNNLGIGAAPAVPKNTNPVFPPLPASPNTGQMRGIETQRADGA